LTKETARLNNEKADALVTGAGPEGVAGKAQKNRMTPDTTTSDYLHNPRQQRSIIVLLL